MVTVDQARRSGKTRTRPAAGGTWAAGPDPERIRGTAMSAWSDDPTPGRWRPAAAAPAEASRDQASWRSTPERSRAWVPLVILVTGLVLLLYSMQLGSMTTSGYDLQRLQSERNEWRQRNEQLQLELAKVQSLAWIEVEAVRRLGMEKADRVTFLEIAPPAKAAGAGEAAAEQIAVNAASAGRFPDLLSIWRGVLAQIVPPIDAGP
jgi:hypothetical protein